MRILVWKDKHEDRYYLADTREQLDASSRSVIETLIEQDYLEGDDLSLARQVLDGDVMAPWQFLQRRDGNEYENFDLVQTQQVEVT